jgi:hypothetical protein
MLPVSRWQPYSAAGGVSIEPPAFFFVLFE